MIDPIKLKPIPMKKMWGEELWTLSVHPKGETAIESQMGKGMKLSGLLEQYPNLIFGNGGYPPGGFPFLIKFITCLDVLSIQVHPNDAYAKLLENERNGKAECWYVLDAFPGATVVYGHRCDSLLTMAEVIRKQEIEKYVQFLPVEPGDFLYVPPGTLHALGKGITVVEIQQTSDITYRIYDWHRTDEKGKQRELHIEKALQVIHFDKLDRRNGTRLTLIEETYEQTFLIATPFFAVELIEIYGSFQGKMDNRFEVITIISGKGWIGADKVRLDVQKGESVLMPACLSAYQVYGSGMKLLKSYVPDLEKDIINPLLNKGFSKSEIDEIIF